MTIIRIMVMQFAELSREMENGCGEQALAMKWWIIRMGPTAKYRGKRRPAAALQRLRQAQWPKR
ncbi:MAG: hypothetical protein ACKV2V_30390 [Blastocatellia bacterium]